MELSKYYNEKETKDALKVPILSLVPGLIILAALVFFIFRHATDAKYFVQAVEGADLKWVFFGVLTEIPTYFLLGGVWFLATRREWRQKLTKMARMSLCQMSIDQLMPIAGLAGNSMALKSLTRLGVPVVVAMEAVMVDVLAYNAAYSMMALVAVFILSFYNGVTPIIVGIVGAYFFISVAVTCLQLFLMSDKVTEIPAWLMRRKIVRSIMEAVTGISPERVFSKSLLAKTIALRLAIFACHILTFWFVMRAVNAPVTFVSAVAALVIAYIAGTVSIMPGGLGTFEVASVGILSLFGVETGTAFAGTLIFRGLAYWVPFIPGMLMVRKELNLHFR